MEAFMSMFGTSAGEDIPACLPPEVEEGNVEYKLKLVDPSDCRFQHLVTQMKWRLQEGQGEALYEIGVEDNGILAGLTDSELTASLETLDRMAKTLGADTTILRKREVESEGIAPKKHVAEVLVRKVPDSQQYIDLKLAVLGNVDAGKSTLLGVLTQGELDNGRGRARLNLFRHLHEIQSGRTSSISHEILGFNSQGEVINYSQSRNAEEICETSTKLITLIDLCGHQKYLKTTIFGLTGYSPDYAMLVVSATSGMVGTSKEHLGYALALGVPVFVIVSKIDMCRAVQVERTVEQLERLLKSPGCKKVPFRVKCEDDAVTAASNFHTESICPIFTISSVSGKRLDLLTKFLNVLPPLHSSKDREKQVQQHAEHQIDVVYSLPGVGIVAGGTVVRGTIKEGENMLVGPADDGSFNPVTVSSIHRNRMPCRVAVAGQASCLSFTPPEGCLVRKGMVLLSKEIQPAPCIEFEADVYLLYHNKYLCKGFQTVIHVANVCQTAKIVKMNKGWLKTNERAVVLFRFNTRPEHIRPGSRLVFREGRTKGMGEVTKIFPYEPPPNR